MASFKKSSKLIHPIPAANRVKIMLSFLKELLTRSEISSKKPVLLQKRALTSTVKRLKFPESQVLIYSIHRSFILIRS